MRKKQQNIEFKLQYIEPTSQDNSDLYPNLKHEYDVETPIDSFPICYLEKEVEQTKTVEPTMIFDSPDEFVSPILGVQGNEVKAGDKTNRSVSAYDQFFKEHNQTLSKEEARRQFDINNSEEYRQMLINGVRPNDFKTQGFSVEEEYEDVPVYNKTSTYEYQEETPKQDYIAPIYPEEPISSYLDETTDNSYEYVEEPAQEYSSSYEEKEPQAEPVEQDVMDYMEESHQREPQIERIVTPKPDFTQQRPKRTRYVAPPVNLLKRNSEKNVKDTAWAEEQKAAINSVFKEFNYGAKAVDYVIGPAVTLFLIDIDPGTDVSKLSSFTKTLTMRLRAKTLRIQDPIPGLGCAGIEIPNEERATVLTGNLITRDFIETDKKLRFVLGLNLNGEPVYGDIEKMPHGLVAGSTGSGKSVCLNTMIVSLIYHNTPEELRFILVDPKMVEFSFYDEIPHLAMPVITEAKKAAPAFKWACEEMDRRYEVFRLNHFRDIKGFNAAQKTSGGRIMPRIVIIIDELADLMLVAGAEIEDYVQRLGAKARAAGIHVILATQRPSTDVVKGTMKNNIPTRIAFKVKSPVDSITILDHAGADKLLGQGDMLYSSETGEDRIQGSYLSDEEIINVCQYLTEHNTVEYLIDSKQLEEKIISDEAEDEEDEKFEEICYYAVRNEIGSANRLMQVFNISFNRANRILLKMERLGILSSTVKGKQREVLVSADELAQILDNDK